MRGASATWLDPATARRVGSSCSVSAGSLYVTAAPVSMVTLADAPPLWAMDSAVRRTRSWMSRRLAVTNASLAGGLAFLCGLENELHRAGQFLSHSRQHLRDAHQHRGVRIVAAGVHNADFLAVVAGAHSGGEGDVHLLRNRQGVHVGPQGDH